ncbi:MAG: hypothetical protein U0359_27990 [Byssovorax sp.]
MELSPLPWLLGHGALVWKAALAVLAGSGVCGAALAPRTISRNQARATRKALGEPLRSLDRLNDGARVTLTGTLEAEAPHCQRFEDGSDAAAATIAYDPSASMLGNATFRAGLNTRAEGLRLRVGEEKVELSGPVEVVIGSREIRRRARYADLPAPARARVEQALGGAKPHFSGEIVQLRSLAPGDTVRVSGVLRKEAKDGESGYRSAKARWILTPVGEEGSLDQGRGLKLAFEGNAAVSGPGPLLLARGAALGLVSFLIVFGLGGEIAACSAADDLAAFQGELGWVRDLDFEVAATIDPKAHPSSPLDTGLGATGFAAATPFRRDQALDRYEDALGKRRDADARLVSIRAALAEQRGRPGEAATILGSHGFTEQAAALAEQRGDRFYAAGLRYTLGDFEKASAAIGDAGTKASATEELRLAAKVHLLSGKGALAAKAARALGERFDDEAKSKKMVRWEASRRAEAARCLALALEARAGNAAARASLKEAALSPARRVGECTLLYADLLPPAERGTMLDGPWDATSLATDTPSAWFDRLKSEADPTFDVRDLSDSMPDPAMCLANPRWALMKSLPGVERSIAEAMGKDASSEDTRVYARLYWAVTAATFDLASGEREPAKRWLAAALADLRKLNAADVEKMRAAGFTPPGPEALTPDFAPKREKIGVMDAALLLDGNDTEGARAMMKKLGIERFWTMPTLIDYREKGEIENLKKNFLGWELIRQGESANWAITAQGDGAALALWMTRLDREPGAYLRIGAPMIKTGKEELGKWLRHGYRPPRWHGDVEGLLFDAVNLRALAEALGDAEVLAREQAKVKRFRDALLARETSVTLAVLERL